NTLVLQDLAGDEWPRGRHLFLFHFPPAEYKVQVEFAAHLGVPRTAPLTLRAAPIIFRIRARTVAEEAEVSELEGMWQMDWDTTSVGGHGGAAYKATLIEWVEKRFGGHADQLAALRTTLGSTLCGQMARYQAQVSRQLQRSRSTQPR